MAIAGISFLKNYCLVAPKHVAKSPVSRKTAIITKGHLTFLTNVVMFSGAFNTQKLAFMFPWEYI